MNAYSRLFFVLLCFLCFACDETVPADKPVVDPITDTINSSTASSGSEDTLVASPPPIGMKAPLPTKHDCKVEDKMLEDNQFWLKVDQTLVAIVADKTTKSIDFGDSHRVFVAMDTRDCKTLLRETLPVNMSPDFPYYLNTNTYEPLNKVICSQGFDAVICYDAVAKKLLPQMKPKYLTDRSAEDAQSGMPTGMEIWNQFLIGNTLDFGSYVFDLSNKKKPKAILPNAEYQNPEDESYTSMFLLEARKSGFYQAFIPSLNEDQDGTEVKKMFKNPIEISTTVTKSVRNNRFIVLKKKDGKSSVAVDMQEMKEVALPAEVSSKGVKDVLDWLKKM